MHIFLSHSSKDAEEARRVCELLEQNDIPCFIAPRDIRLGKEYAEEIVDGIDQAAAVILLLSEEANKSPHVLREVERAVSRSIPILVYKLEEVTLSKSMEYFLMTHQWMNAQSQKDDADVLKFARNMMRTERGQQEKSKNDSGREEGNRADKKKKGIFFLGAGILAAALLAVGIFGFMTVNRKSAAERLGIEPGDTITFGSYNGEPIDWRVLKISEDGNQAVLIAADILTMKAYDAAESGFFNRNGDEDYWARESAADTDMDIQVLARGNSDWRTSNIRTWLNSSAEVVTYTDHPPMATAMAEKKNGYHNEAGFLHDFTEEELLAIVETQVETKGNALATDDVLITTDRVFLLSVDELSWFDEAGISKLAVPTQAAVEQDQSYWYTLDRDTYGVKEYCWWLREPVEGTASKCYLVGNGYTQDNIQQENVGLEGFGIRPALTVDLNAAVFEKD